MRFRLLIPVLILTVLSAGFITRIMTNRPPEGEVMEARQSLAEASFERAAFYSGESFSLASSYFDSAMIQWKYQNERFILFRNYKNVAELAGISLSYSKEAIQTSRETISDTEDQLKARLDNLGDRIENFDMIFKRFPMAVQHRDSLTRSKLMYSESLQAYYNEHYLICRAKLESVEASFGELSAFYMEKLHDYFDDYSSWDALVEQSISLSKKNHSHVLVVDKMARVLYVYKNGTVYRQYPVELGSNWVGDKMQQGDRSTPEGIYKILDKKQNGQTKYHRAFLLNYPNEEDKKRFTANKRNGIIADDASIGNLIEIHGSGGKGTDWTDGCIALQDIHMDELFPLCQVGTRVTIVGSTKSLDELSFNLL